MWGWHTPRFSTIQDTNALEQMCDLDLGCQFGMPLGPVYVDDEMHSSPFLYVRWTTVKHQDAIIAQMFFFVN
jgi:hypothetical protein